MASINGAFGEGSQFNSYPGQGLITATSMRPATAAFQHNVPAIMSAPDRSGYRMVKSSASPMVHSEMALLYWHLLQPVLKLSRCSPPRSGAIPKKRIKKNKSREVGVSFTVKIMTVKRPRFTTEPPQTHQQNTTHKHPFSSKPPAKHHKPTTQKKWCQTRLPQG
jgi:hypothetical protein